MIQTKTKPPRALLIGDPHFGTRADKTIFQNIVERYFKTELVRIIRENEVEDAFLLGDLFDSRTISVKTLNIALNCIEDISRECTLHCIPGNHDFYYKASKEFHSLNLLKGIPNVTVYTEPTVVKLKGRTIYFVPWLQTTEDKLLFEEELRGLSPEICLGHFAINHFEMVRGYTETRGFSPGLFNNHTGRTYSGHFHIRYERGNITYVGTPYQLTWNDYGNTKGVYLLNLRNLSCEFVENTTSPTFQKVFLSELDNMGTDGLRLRVKGNFVKFLINKKVSEERIRETIQILEDMNPISTSVITSKMDEEIDKGNEDKLIEDIKTPIKFFQNYVDRIKLPNGIKKDNLLRYFLSALEEVNSNGEI